MRYDLYCARQPHFSITELLPCQEVLVNVIAIHNKDEINSKTILNSNSKEITAMEKKTPSAVDLY